MNDRSLFRSSIYYSNRNWNNLFKNGINPFLIKTASYFKHYYIFLSNYRGEHVKLIFELNEITKTEFSLIFENYFERFINATKSSEPECQFTPGKSLWMNFENNTIEINKFDTHFLNYEKDFLLFSQALSKLISQLFLESGMETIEMNMEVSIGFLIKLFISIEKSIIIEILDTAINTIIKTSDLSIRKALVDEALLDSYKAAIDNQEIINDYFKEDLSKTENSEDKLKIHLIDWLNIGNQIIEHNNFDHSIVKEKIQKIIHLYTIQMGYDELSKIYLLNILAVFYKFPIGN
jgi:hypothetical protein